MKSISEGGNTLGSKDGGIQKLSFTQMNANLKNDSNPELDRVLDTIRQRMSIKTDSEQLSFISHDPLKKNNGSESLINKLKKRISGNMIELPLSK